VCENIAKMNRPTHYLYMLPKLARYVYVYCVFVFFWDLLIHYG